MQPEKFLLVRSGFRRWLLYLPEGGNPRQYKTWDKAKERLDKELKLRTA